MEGYGTKRLSCRGIHTTKMASILFNLQKLPRIRCGLFQTKTINPKHQISNKCVIVGTLLLKKICQMYCLIRHSVY